MEHWKLVIDIGQSSIQGFTQDFLLEGEIVAHGNTKLGGLGACSPRKILKFTTSETASETTFRNRTDEISMKVGNSRGGGGQPVRGENPLVPHPLKQSLVAYMYF